MTQNTQRSPVRVRFFDGPVRTHFLDGNPFPTRLTTQFPSRDSASAFRRFGKFDAGYFAGAGIDFSKLLSRAWLVTTTSDAPSAEEITQREQLRRMWDAIASQLDAFDAAVRANEAVISRRGPAFTGNHHSVAVKTGDIGSRYAVRPHQLNEINKTFWEKQLA